MSEGKISHNGDEKNVATLAGQYSTGLNALHSAGASLETALFLFHNTGICLTVCQRLVALRENSISEHVMADLLALVWQEEG